MLDIANPWATLPQPAKVWQTGLTVIWEDSVKGLTRFSANFRSVPTDSSKTGAPNRYRITGVGSSLEFVIAEGYFNQFNIYETTFAAVVSRLRVALGLGFNVANADATYVPSLVSFEIRGAT